MNVPYTYLIKCVPTNQFYYGVRYSKDCHPDDLWQTYYTSSAYIKHLIHEYGKESFIYEIRKTFSSATKARKWEERVLKKLNVSIREDFINKSDNSLFDTRNRVWVNNGITSKFIDSIRLDEYTSNGWSKGRYFSDEHKTKISSNRIGKTSGENNHMFGKSHSDKSKLKMSNTRKGNVYRPLKLTHEIRKEITDAYMNVYIDVPHTPHGKQLTYKGAFCQLYAKKYNVTYNAIRNLLN